MASSSSSATALCSSILLSQSEKAFIRAGCRDDCRLDGRKRHEFSTYTLTSTATPSSTTTTTTTTSSSYSYPETLYFSNGSARLLATTVDPATSSHLQILCSVKADIVRPAPEKPNQGLIELHVDSMLQQQQQQLQASRSSNMKKLEQLQAALQQLVLHDSYHNALLLCLVQGEYAWRLSIDLLLIPAVDATSTGRLLDACSHVLRAALQSTRLPAIQVVLPATTTTTTTTTSTSSNTPNDKINSSSSGSGSRSRHELLVDSDVHHSHTPMLHQQAPVIVTVTVIPTTTTTTTTSSKLGGGGGGGGITTTPVLVLDATAAEEASAMAVVHVAFVQESNSNSNNKDKTQGSSSSNISNNITVCGIRLQGSLPTACLPECIATATEALQDGRIDRAYRPCQTDDDKNNRHRNSQNAFLPPSILLQ